MKMPTPEQCKRILFNLGIKFGVSPKLISLRLLSQEDKDDMLNGLIPQDSLEVAVQVWRDTGMRNYSDGSGLRYKASEEKPMSRYRGRGDR